MQPIPILMPLKDGHSIHSDSLAAISKQAVPTRLIIISRPATEPESTARNILLSLIPPAADICFFLDSDVMLTSPFDLPDLACALRADNGTSLDILAINTKQNTSNLINISCSVWLSSFARSFTFLPDKHATLESLNATARIRLLDTRTRVELPHS